MGAGVRDRPHVVHVHDLLALRSALGENTGKSTSITGRMYNDTSAAVQKARHFVSISRKTQADLHRVGGVSAITSEVVYNGLNFPFSRLAHGECEKILSEAGLPMPASGDVCFMWVAVSGTRTSPASFNLYAHYAAASTRPSQAGRWRKHAHRRWVRETHHSARAASTAAA